MGLALPVAAMAAADPPPTVINTAARPAAPLLKIPVLIVNDFRPEREAARYAACGARGLGARTDPTVRWSPRSSHRSKSASLPVGFIWQKQRAATGKYPNQSHANPRTEPEPLPERQPAGRRSYARARRDRERSRDCCSHAGGGNTSAAAFLGGSARSSRTSSYAGDSVGSGWPVPPYAAPPRSRRAAVRVAGGTVPH